MKNLTWLDQREFKLGTKLAKDSSDQMMLSQKLLEDVRLTMAGHEARKCQWKDKQNIDWAVGTTVWPGRLLLMMFISCLKMSG